MQPLTHIHHSWLVMLKSSPCSGMSTHEVNQQLARYMALQHAATNSTWNGWPCSMQMHAGIDKTAALQVAGQGQLWGAACRYCSRQA